MSSVTAAFSIPRYNEIVKKKHMRVSLFHTTSIKEEGVIMGYCLDQARFNTEDEVKEVARC